MMQVIRVQKVERWQQIERKTETYVWNFRKIEIFEICSILSFFELLKILNVSIDFWNSFWIKYGIALKLFKNFCMKNTENS